MLLKGDEIRATSRHEVLEEEGNAVAHAALVPVARVGQRTRQAVQDVEIHDIKSPQWGGRHGQRRKEAEDGSHTLRILPGVAHTMRLIAHDAMPPLRSTGRFHVRFRRSPYGFA
jgi:hypothetical protein